MAQRNIAWGLEFGGSAVRLVRVVRTPDGYQIDRCAQADLKDRWIDPPDLGEALGRLQPERIHEPLAVCIADELILYRSLSLPRANEAALSKMVEAQRDVLVPTRRDVFVWGWTHGADPLNGQAEHVLLCAARQDAVARVTGCCKLLGPDPSMIMPSSVALAAASRPSAAGASPDRVVLLLDVAARATSMILLARGRVLRCGVLDQGADHWTERIAEELGVSCDRAEAFKLKHAATAGEADESDAAVSESLRRAMTDWSWQLREVRDGCMENIPADRRPGRCVLFGRAARTPGLAELVAGILQMDVTRAPKPAELRAAEEVEFSQAAPAIGAALCELDADRPRVTLAARGAPAPPVAGKALARWAAILAGLLAAVLVLYGLDVAEARWLENAVQQVRAAARQQGGLDRQLAVARYLQRGCAPPLAVLEELSAQSPAKAILTTLQFGRTGEVTIAGTVPDEKDLHALLENLRTSSMFRDVKPGPTRKDKNKIQFDVSLKIGHAVPRPSTQPATQPTSVPAPEATTAKAEQAPEAPKPGETEAPAETAEPPESAEETPAPETPEPDETEAAAETTMGPSNDVEAVTTQPGGGS